MCIETDMPYSDLNREASVLRAQSVGLWDGVRFNELSRAWAVWKFRKEPVKQKLGELEGGALMKFFPIASLEKISGKVNTE